MLIRAILGVLLLLDKLKKVLGVKGRKLDYKEAVLYMARAIEKRDMQALERIMLEDSKQRFGEDKKNAFLIMRSLIDMSFRNDKYIEIADKYIIDDNTVIANAFYWVLDDKGLLPVKFRFYDMEKKDLGVFVDTTQSGVKVNLDGLLKVNILESNTEFEGIDYKFYISASIKYYNQKMLRLKVYNNLKNRLFFKRVVDGARVRIYSNNLYEEKTLGLNTDSCLELEDKAEFLITSEGGSDYRIECIEAFNYCVEHEIGNYEVESMIVYKRGDSTFNKTKVDSEIKKIRGAVDKILECRTLNDFREITDIEVMKRYYKEFLASESLDEEKFFNKVLEAYRVILNKYRVIRIGKINLEENFYKIKLLVEINGADGFIDVSLNKENYKFLFLTEYITEIIDNKQDNLECKTDKLDGASITYSFCEKSKLFMINAKGKEKYLNEPNYIRVNIVTDNGFFTDYLEFGKCYDTDLENSIENIDTEDDIKRWQREKGFTFTTTFLHGANSILKVILEDNTDYMVKHKRKTY